MTSRVFLCSRTCTRVCEVQKVMTDGRARAITIRRPRRQVCQPKFVPDKRFRSAVFTVPAHPPPIPVPVNTAVKTIVKKLTNFCAFFFFFKKFTSEELQTVYRVPVIIYIIRNARKSRSYSNRRQSPPQSHGKNSFRSSPTIRMRNF